MSINLSPLWNSNAGYFFYLRHADDKGKRSTEEEYYKFLNYSKFGKIGTYGFHVFLNDRNEMFTESPNQQEVFVEYVYLQQGEELEVNIKAEEFSKLSVKDDHCNSDHDYSYSKVNNFHTNLSIIINNLLKIFFSARNNALINTLQKP